MAQTLAGHCHGMMQLSVDGVAAKYAVAVCSAGSLLVVSHLASFCVPCTASARSHRSQSNALHHGGAHVCESTPACSVVAFCSWTARVTGWAAATLAQVKAWRSAHVECAASGTARTPADPEAPSHSAMSVGVWCSATTGPVHGGGGR